MRLSKLLMVCALLLGSLSAGEAQARFRRCCCWEQPCYCQNLGGPTKPKAGGTVQDQINILQGEIDILQGDVAGLKAQANQPPQANQPAQGNQPQR